MRNYHCTREESNDALWSGRRWESETRGMEREVVNEVCASIVEKVDESAGSALQGKYPAIVYCTISTISLVNVMCYGKVQSSVVQLAKRSVMNLKFHSGQHSWPLFWAVFGLRV